MPYYRPAAGDYRTYGYGQGDPGWLSNLWKGVKKVAAPLIGTLIGGPVGGIIGGLAGGRAATPPIMAPVKPTPRISTRFDIGPISARGTQYYPTVPQFRGTPMPSGAAGMKGVAMPDGTGCCPVGYHPAKDGSGRCVRNRRMNVANPKALRRSMRRVQGFEKLAKRTISFTRRVKMKK